jgi:hypothetical protein
MVPPLSSDKDESYWLGVRDALRMIDSFVAWSRRNPNRAKKIDDFIDDALIAVNKHCRSCLSQALGISFGESGGEEAAVDFGDRKGGQVRGARPEFSATGPSVFSAEYPSDFQEAEGEEALEPPDLPDLEHDEALYTEPPLSEMPDMSRMGSAPQGSSSPEKKQDERAKDFLSEFPLTEPASLETESSLGEEHPHPQGAEGPAPIVGETTERLRSPEEKTKGSKEAHLPAARDDSEDSFYERGVDIGFPMFRGTSEQSPDWERTEKASEKASEGFSWEEYERTISSPPLPEEPKVSTRSSDSAGGKPSATWTPYDEPSEEESKTIEHGPTKPEEESEDEDESEKDTTRPTVRPPPPPPRPESEESDEERKKRARRLFFGT